MNVCSVLHRMFYGLRLDNTGAWVIEVYPSLLCNQVSEHVDLYIKLKLVIHMILVIKQRNDVQLS